MKAKVPMAHENHNMSLLHFWGPLLSRGPQLSFPAYCHSCMMPAESLDITSVFQEKKGTKCMCFQESTEFYHKATPADFCIHFIARMTQTT
jgi:hypothetical protein